MNEEVTSSVSSPGPGFLGSTSFSAIFNEDQGIDCSASLFRSDALEEEAAVPSSIRPGRVEQGAEVLANLIEWPSFALLLQKWHLETYGLTLFSPWVELCMKTIDEEFYQRLVAPREVTEKDLLVSLSEGVFRNSSKPLKFDGSYTIDQFAMLFNGPNVRWETIGIYFTCIGLSTMETSTLNPGPGGGSGFQQRNALLRRMLDLGQTCLRLCAELGHLTDPEILLHIEHTRFTSVIEGDANYLTWQRLGDLTSALFAKGLHMEIKVTAEVPFWLSEHRKQAFAAAYCIDEGLSVFTGRPPRLSQRYCCMQLPLELDIHMFHLQGRELEEAVNSLDSAGWSITNLKRSTFWLRASLISNMIREEILELSLGSMAEVDIAYTQQLSDRLENAWLSIPERIRIRATMPPGFDSPDWFILLSVYLDFQYNRFLLYRVVVKRFQTSAQELLDVAQWLLTAVLNIMQNSARLGRFISDIPWILAKYGVTSAGPLALELLRWSQIGSRPGIDPVLPRSEVIQSLSKLVANLKSLVRKEDGNYTICFQARKMIQRILDQVLESEAFGGAPRSGSAVGTGKGEEEGGLDVCGDEPWLGLARSELDFWMALPNHPLLTQKFG